MRSLTDGGLVQHSHQRELRRQVPQDLDGHWLQSMGRRIWSLPVYVGSMVSGPLADWMSQRWCLILALAIFTLGSGLLTGAQNIPIFVGGRFISGISVGMFANIIVCSILLAILGDLD
jgi:hypothetical protein